MPFYSEQKLVAEFVNDLDFAKQLELNTFQQRHIGYRLLESTARLLSPLL
jgi:cardiolipin synthase